MLSYSRALDLGFDPIQYRTDFLNSLELGPHDVVVDAVVWSKRTPAAIALLRDKDGNRLAVVKVKRAMFNGKPYGGLTDFSNGEIATLVVEAGSRISNSGHLLKKN